MENMVKSICKTVASGDIIVYSASDKSDDVHKAYYKSAIAGSPRRIKDFKVSEYSLPDGPITNTMELLEHLVQNEGYKYM